MYRKISDKKSIKKQRLDTIKKINPNKVSLTIKVYFLRLKNNEDMHIEMLLVYKRSFINNFYYKLNYVKG